MTTFDWRLMSHNNSFAAELYIWVLLSYKQLTYKLVIYYVYEKQIKTFIFILFFLYIQ